MNRIKYLALCAVVSSLASPAFAGSGGYWPPRETPAPLVGAGIGAAVLIGIGYRALKSRIGR